MTRAQREWVERIGQAGTCMSIAIPNKTRKALVGHGLVEEVGVYHRRVQLTSLGKATRVTQRAVLAAMGAS